MHSHYIIAPLAFLAGLSVSAYPKGHQCIEHRSLSGEIVSEPAQISADPLAHFDSPMVTVFNETVSENWSFDATSHDGKTSIVLYLTRGTVANNVAAQRGLISVAWANGTRYMESAFLDVSVLTTCPDATSGLWMNDLGDTRWGFAASNDYKDSVVNIRSPTINGSFTLKSRGPPIYPGGLVYPDARASVLFAPEMYWQEQCPIADAEVSLKVGDTPFTLSGIGGRDKNWNSRPWAVISGNWDMVRAIVGPYGLMLWNYTSTVDGRSYFSATLTRGDRVIFRTANQGPSCSGSYGTVRLTDKGPIHLSAAPGTESPIPESRHSGYLINLVSPETKEHWRFALDFSQTTFWFPASDAITVGQFAGKISGGVVNGTQYEGVASGSLQEYVL